MADGGQAFMNVLRCYRQPGLFISLTISFFLSNVASGIIGTIVYMLYRSRYDANIIAGSIFGSLVLLPVQVLIYIYLFTITPLNTRWYVYLPVAIVGNIGALFLFIHLNKVINGEMSHAMIYSNQYSVYVIIIMNPLVNLLLRKVHWNES